MYIYINIHMYMYIYIYVYISIFLHVGFQVGSTKGMNILTLKAQALACVNSPFFLGFKVLEDFHTRKPVRNWR